MAGETRLEVAPLTTSECWARLRETRMGRVAVTVGALPVILPVFFVVDGTSILFRTAARTKLAGAASDAVVAFECDGYDPVTSAGWSVVVQGLARPVVDPAQRERLMEALPLRMSADGLPDRLLSVTAAVVSGRRVAPSPEP